MLGIAYLDGLIYGLLICAACALAAVELRGMLRAAHYAPLDLTLIGLAVLLPLDAWLSPSAGGWSIAPEGVLIVVVVLMASLVALVLRRGSEHAMVDWALSLVLGLYLGGLMQFYLPLRRAPADVPGFWVMAVLGLSWICDSCAYFVGRAFGRTPLAPTVSPRKSLEGAIAGLVGATLAGLLLALLPIGVSPLVLGGFGLAIGLATVLGDLAESLLKRQTGVKDSGVLIPGHGGLLDRMDSLLFCAPVAVVYLHAFAAAT